MITSKPIAEADRAGLHHVLDCTQRLISNCYTYVLPEKLPGFKHRIGKLQKNFEASWMQTTSNYVNGTHKQYLHRNKSRALTRFISQVIKEANQSSNDNWEMIDPVCRELWLNQMRIKRRHELCWPRSKTSFVQTLWWMIEQGMEEELDLVRKVKASPPFTSKEIFRLLNLVDRQICKRVSDPYYVMEHGEEAYRRHQQEWELKYAGEYVAIYGNEIIDADIDKAALISRTMEIQRNIGRFRSYIVKISEPLASAKASMGSENS